MNQTNNIAASDILYDVCFISMSELNSDARTLNIMRTLTKNKMKVSVIAFGSEQDALKFKNEGIFFFPISKPGFKKASKQWRYFNKECKKFFAGVKARSYWASDFFSLKTSRNLSKKYDAKLFYDSREIYSAIASLTKRKFKQFIQTKLELKWVKSVDKIIVTGELDKEYLEKHFGSNIPFYVIKNFPPFRQAVKSNIIREKFNIPDNEKILLYQGMLLKGRGIIPVVKALPLLDNFVFCLLGDGDLEDEIIKTAGELGVKDKVILAGRVDYDELHEWTCSADIGMGIIEPISFSYELALPNKIFEYCMASIPCIVSDLPAMKYYIDKYSFGKTLSKYPSADDIANAVLDILDKNNYEKYISASNIAAKEISFESQADIVLSVFKDVKAGG